MSLTALVVCLFVLPCQAQGDVREETLYVKTGTDLVLDVKNPVPLKEYDSMFWIFNQSATIVKLSQTNEIVSFGIYKGRAELFPQNQSLLLKNVQKTDIGEYRAVVSGNRDRVLVKYQVTVLDPVSEVKLGAKQCSSDRSDLTVTCTTMDGLLNNTFICDKTTCSHEGGEQVQNIPPGSSMNVSLQKGFVTCNHSNLVSYRHDTSMIALLCFRRKDEAPKDDPSKMYVPILTFTFGSVCGAAVYFLCHRKRLFWQRLLCCCRGRRRKKVRTGTDLLLDAENPVQLNQKDELCWKFQKEVNIVKFTQTSGPVYHPDYAGRAEFSPQNQSLLLKNVQTTDSGQYRAVCSGDIDKVLVKHQVTVHGRPTMVGHDQEMNQLDEAAL